MQPLPDTPVVPLESTAAEGRWRGLIAACHARAGTKLKGYGS